MRVKIDAEANDLFHLLKLLDYAAGEVEEYGGKPFSLLATLPDGGGSVGLSVQAFDSHTFTRLSRIQHGAVTIPKEDDGVSKRMGNSSLGAVASVPVAQEEGEESNELHK